MSLRCGRISGNKNNCMEITKTYLWSHVGISLTILLCGFLIISFPSKAHAIQYTFEELSADTLALILKDVEGYKTTINGLKGSGVSEANTAPTQKLIDSARSQLQEAIRTRPSDTAENATKSEWLTRASAAMGAVDAANTGVQTLVRYRSAPTRQISLNAEKAKCAEGKPDCNPAMITA